MKELRHRVYVAASSREVQRAVAVIAMCRAEGLEVAHDWTTDVIAYAGTIPDDAARKRIAEADMAGVMRARALILLVPVDGTSGGGYEAGVAAAFGRFIVCAGPHRRRFLFGVRHHEVDTDIEAVKRVVEWARKA
jgi:hypothetical protein